MNGFSPPGRLPAGRLRRSIAAVATAALVWVTAGLVAVPASARPVDLEPSTTAGRAVAAAPVAGPGADLDRR